MDYVPAPYDRDVQLEPGEEVIGCWRAVPARLREDGSLVPLVRHRGLVDRDNLNPELGLLLLTDRRIRHYYQFRTRDVHGDLQADARGDLAIPHPMVSGVDLRQLPGSAHRLLMVQMENDEPLLGIGDSTGAISGVVFFVLEPDEDREEVLAELIDAAQAGGAPISTSPGPEQESPPTSGGDVGEDGASEDESGPVHFHSEQERE